MHCFLGSRQWLSCMLAISNLFSLFSVCIVIINAQVYVNPYVWYTDHVANFNTHSGHPFFHYSKVPFPFSPTFGWIGTSLWLDYMCVCITGALSLYLKLQTQKWIAIFNLYYHISFWNTWFCIASPTFLLIRKVCIGLVGGTEFSGRRA